MNELELGACGRKFVGEGYTSSMYCTQPAGHRGIHGWVLGNIYEDGHAPSGMPTDAAARKDTPVFSGVLAYFPDAIAEVARVSKVGNDQHNPGQPLHWAKEKSSDEADALVRHLLERGKRDADGMRHTAKVAWRALALLQREMDAEHREGE